MLKKYIWIADSPKEAIYRKNEAEWYEKTWRGQYHAAKVSDNVAINSNNNQV